MRGLREAAANLLLDQTGNADRHQSGKAFFGSSSGKDIEHGDARVEMDRDEMLDKRADLKVKEKRDRQGGPSPGASATVAVTTDDRPRSKAGGDRPTGKSPLSTESKPAPKTATSTTQSGSAVTRKNFTFDDFEGLEMGNDTALTAALQREEEERQAKQREEEEKAEKARKKAEKERKKKAKH